MWLFIFLLGSTQSPNTEIKRNTTLTPKKEEPSSLAGRSISNSKNSNSTDDEDSRPGDRAMFMRRQKYFLIIFFS